MALSTAQLEAFRRNLGERTVGRQRETAERAGISWTHLSRIIHGHAEPGLAVAMRIAEALDTTVDALAQENSETGVDAA